MNTQKAALIEKIIHACSQCGRCQEECVFLKEFELDPKEFVGKTLEEGSDDLDILYSCNLCGICKDICEEDIDLSKFFLLLREEAINRNGELPPAYEWVKERLDWISKGAFVYAQGSAASEGKCEKAFFPGCTLSGYNPRLVLETYSYLRERDPSTGIVLNCCGALFQGVGENDGFNNAIQAIRLQIEKIGACHIITACPTCYRVFKECLPEFELSLVYETMEKEWAPKVGKNHDEKFYLFHSCPTRHEKSAQRSIHNLIEKMGYQVVEKEVPQATNKCCGMGGLVGLNNPVLAFIVGQERTEGISHDIVTYCAACREALVQYRPSLHLLDLAFNPNWKQDKDNPPLDDTQIRQNLTWLKSTLSKA